MLVMEALALYPKEREERLRQNAAVKKISDVSLCPVNSVCVVRACVCVCVYVYVYVRVCVNSLCFTNPLDLQQCQS